MNQVTEALEPEPVFVDPTGRRGRIVRRTGIGLASILVGYLGIVTYGLATETRVPLTPWPVAKPSASRSPLEYRLMPRVGTGVPLQARGSSAGGLRTRPRTRVPAAPARASATPAHTRRVSPTPTTTSKVTAVPATQHSRRPTVSPGPKKP